MLQSKLERHKAGVKLWVHPLSSGGGNLVAQMYEVSSDRTPETRVFSDYYSAVKYFDEEASKCSQSI
jgi:hypothetical protein